MIPREILKKIRQIELRTNRVVSETLAGALFQSALQFRGISGPMPNRGDDHLGCLVVDCEINGIRPRARNLGSARQPAGETEPFRIQTDRFEKRSQFVRKPLAESLLPLVVKANSLRKFPLSFLLDQNAKAHRFARNCFSISAITSSRGRHFSGCARARSARRSSSAICSGVSVSSTSPNSISMASTSSRRSASGMRRSSSRISALLMTTIYRAVFTAQAGFSASLITRYSSLVTFRS